MIDTPVAWQTDTELLGTYITTANVPLKMKWKLYFGHILKNGWKLEIPFSGYQIVRSHSCANRAERIAEQEERTCCKKASHIILWKQIMTHFGFKVYWQSKLKQSTKDFPSFLIKKYCLWWYDSRYIVFPGMVSFIVSWIWNRHRATLSHLVREQHNTLLSQPSLKCAPFCVGATLVSHQSTSTFFFQTEFTQASHHPLNHDVVKWFH